MKKDKIYGICYVCGKMDVELKMVKVSYKIAVIECVNCIQIKKQKERVKNEKL